MIPRRQLLWLGCVSATMIAAFALWIRRHPAPLPHEASIQFAGLTEGTNKFISGTFWEKYTASVLPTNGLRIWKFGLRRPRVYFPQPADVDSLSLWMQAHWQFDSYEKVFQQWDDSVRIVVDGPDGRTFENDHAGPKMGMRGSGIFDEAVTWENQHLWFYALLRCPLTAYPRDQKCFTVRFLGLAESGNSWTNLAEVQVRNPRVEAAPLINWKDGQIITASPGFSPAKLLIGTGLVFRAEYRLNSVAMANTPSGNDGKARWEIVLATIQDRLGNFHKMKNGPTDLPNLVVAQSRVSLDPSEVWKVHLECARTSGFTPEEIIRCRVPADGLNHAFTNEAGIRITANFQQRSLLLSLPPSQEQAILSLVEVSNEAGQQLTTAAEAGSPWTKRHYTLITTPAVLNLSVAVQKPTVLEYFAKPTPASDADVRASVVRQLDISPGAL